MVSAAEQLAANLNFSALAKAEELKKRIWFTLGALLVYRFGTYIPLPGIDPAAWEQIFKSQAGGILGMFNMFSGGGIHRMASIALIIMSGIVAELPSAIAGMLELGRQGALSTGLILVVIVMAVAVIAFIVFMERAQRRLLIQYPKRQVGNRMFEGQSSHLPLKLNTSGVIPPIFASSLLLLPTTVANFNAGQGPDWFVAITTQLGHGRPLFLTLSIEPIVFFAFFYTAIVFNPTETAENLKKHGGFIPGIRPGERTAEYIDYVLSRITVIGAIYLAIVCLI